ncbi:peptide ABC transporter permease [Roseateles aquatilis]|uniref:Peptide ABC transporter permease n=1 Tax=Roseateles aquatilis TaxID=431061 RepID=A0A246J0P6_9BURK|nr:ABC transporter permease [Roseateles aquatilis]OWQ85754.1 peptide ABC transporter permease [Roseateles aquatilis]
MGTLWRLAAQSAWNRRFVLSLVALSIALSTIALFGMARVKQDVRETFSESVSGTDLIVGARTGPVQLLLYSVFRIGSATNNIGWSSVQALSRLPAVAWVVPISLGDSHRGFPVVATSSGYFEHFRYGDALPLTLAQGRAFRDAAEADPTQPHTDIFGAVLGAEVAAALGYRLGDALVLSHGDGALAANDHADKPFRVIGILARTGTPVDRSVHITLAGMEAIHLDWVAGAPLPGMAVAADDVGRHDLTPRQVTAALVGLKQRSAVFAVQRKVNAFGAEPLLAVLPGVALDELWDAVALGERGLQLMSGLVALVSLTGLVAVIWAGLNERRRELAILRAVGAGPRHVLALLALEGMAITLIGVAAGTLLSLATVYLAGPWVQAHYGLRLSAAPPRPDEWRLLLVVLGCGWLASLLPGLRAYALSLSDGLSPRT